MGRIRVSRRWELGVPLLIAGALTAGLTVGAGGSGLVFWAGALLAAVGAGLFFGSRRGD